MTYKNEFNFLRDVLKKSRIHSFTASPNTLTPTLGSPFSEKYLSNVSISEPIEPYTLYKMSDVCGLSYIYFLLPETEEPSVFVIGPFLSAPPSEGRLLELGEILGIVPSQQKYFTEQYSGIPVISEGDSLLVMISSFCERIWKRPSFAIVDVNTRHQISVSPINSSMLDGNLDDVLLNMKAMETRYAFENELIRAVTLGQLHKEDQLLSAFSGNAFEKRLPDQLRNAKNYGIIMNTLLRKAAENGGVHPVYLDRVSSKYAAKIEQLSDLSGSHSLMCEMFRNYCRLVRNHSMKNYSLAVKKAILLIDSDLSADLSLRSISDSQKVSEGYLSSIFKKETGKTVSEYIRDKRIAHATHLLATTNLQVQTVALHCGIMDVQYFSKIFKRVTGKTPKEYRQTLNEQKNVGV